MSAPAPALVELARTVRRPTIFRPGFPSVEPQECASLAEVADELRRMAPHKPLTFVGGRCAYPDFDDFASVTARLDGAVLCIVGGPWRSEAALTEARDELRGRT